MHANHDSAKLPAVAGKCCTKVRSTLAHDAGDRAGRGDELQRVAAGVVDLDALRDRTREQSPDRAQQRFLAHAPLVPGAELRVAFEHAGKRRQRVGPGHRLAEGRVTEGDAD